MIAGAFLSVKCPTRVSPRHLLQSFEAESGWAVFVNDTRERILVSEKFGIDNPRGSFQLREFTVSQGGSLSRFVILLKELIKEGGFFFFFLTERMRRSWAKWGNWIKQSLGKVSGFYIYDHLGFCWGCDLPVRKSFFIRITGSFTWKCSIPSPIWRLGTIWLSRFPS